MEIELDQPFGDYQIQSYSPGQIKINNQTYHHTIVISLDSLETDWKISAIEELTKLHLEKILLMKPDILLIGTGATTKFLTSELTSLLHENNIGIESMTTDAACRTFNVLSTEKRAVVAILFL
ncbi:MAG: MTH938/NDUFAF3 family protein [Pseudomonadota bacterium]